MGSKNPEKEDCDTAVAFPPIAQDGLISVRRIHVAHEVPEVSPDAYARSNASARDSIEGPTLHTLMHLRLDKQGYGFVEKVIIPPDEIERFCNEVRLKSAACRDGTTLLDFNALNSESAHVVGLYGSKKVIAQIFAKLGLHGVVSSMSNSRDVGIYAFLHQGVLFIVYWHEGARMVKASRKHVSCNFIRYVADLCATVYICLDDENDVDLSLMTSARSTSAAPRKQRTQRLQISKIKQAENDVKLREGFRECPTFLSRVSRDSKTLGNVGTSSRLETSCRLAGGLHRCVLLSSSVVPAKTTLTQDKETVDSQLLANLVQGWCGSFHLDFTQLPYQELCLFLEHAGFEWSTGFRSLRKSQEDRKNHCVQRGKSSAIEDLMQGEQQTVLRILSGDASKAYLDRYHPWLQGLLTTSGVSPSGVASSPVHSVFQPNDLLQAEAALVDIWTGDVGQLQARKKCGSFIFVGTEFQMIEKDTNSAWKPYSGTAKFIVDRISSPLRSEGLSAGPILYGEEFVATPKGDGEGFLATPKSHIRLICKAPSEDFCEGPILTCRLIGVTIQYGNASTQNPQDWKGQLVTDETSVNGMLTWMEQYGRPIVRPFQASIDALAWALATPEVFNESDACGIRSRILEVAYKIAVSRGDKKSQFQDQFSKRALQELLKTKGVTNSVRSEFSSGDLPLDKIAPEERKWMLDLVREAYKQALEEFSSRLKKMVSEEVAPLLKKKIEFEVRRKHVTKILERRQEREVRQFVQKQLSSGTHQEHRLSVSRCFWKEQGKYNQARNFILGVTSQAENRAKQLVLQYEFEKTESQRISWEVAEFTPMQEDLQHLMSDSGLVINPRCSENLGLIEVDMESEMLSQVVAVKSGPLLVFMEDREGVALHLFVLSSLGVDMRAVPPVKTFKRGYDLVAVDETAKLVGLYDRELAKIEILIFQDESFRVLECSGVTLELREHCGIGVLKSLSFIPGRREMVLVDEEFRVRVFEMSTAMQKAGDMQLPGPAHKICVSTDGSCLMAFYKFLPGGPDPATDLDGLARDRGQTGTQLEMEKYAEGILKVEVYLLGESIRHLKTLSLDYAVADVVSIDATVVAFGSQVHLVLLDVSRPERGICSKVLDITSASEACQLQLMDSARISSARNDTVGHGCPALEYIYHIYEKYATNPPLIEEIKELHLHLLFAGESREKLEALKRESVKYVNDSIRRLAAENGKDLSHLTVHLSSGNVDSYIVDNALLESTGGRNRAKLGDWTRRLVCLVPIQLARAENNSLRPLVDGLQNPNLMYGNAVELAEALRFGFYESVLAHWSGNLKVISSMGKQSSGKSYLLNHLAGSLLDVSGGRCTDGAWMTIRESKSCLYVLLDFEGLGSFERSEQEDMLLSLLNAAVSNITIFNKKDFSLDKDTEVVFKRFQNGVSLVKEDSRLFKGLFYLAIKDVNGVDVDALTLAFTDKVSGICKESVDNFLTKMYGGNVVIATMSPFQKLEYYESVASIATLVKEELKAVHCNGSSFAVDLKLVMAQIATKDWSPIDSKRLTLKVELLKRHMRSAISLGKLMGQGASHVLTDFATQKEVADMPVEVDGVMFHVVDTGLELYPSEETQVISDIVEALNDRFQCVEKRTGMDDERWHTSFEKFLMALADRRRNRILEWLRCNTEEFQELDAYVDVQKLRLEAIATLAEVKQSLSLCISKCETCFLRCSIEKNHSDKHTCRGTHNCSAVCTFCLEEQSKGLQCHECSDRSGHDGPHDCKLRNHTCSNMCALLNSSNCNQHCAKRPGHEGDHRCNTRQHVCAKKCSLPECSNPCTIAVDCGEHHDHECHEKMCPMTCIMDGCNRKCGIEDHFHSLYYASHFCGDQHTCPMNCEADGICEIVTEVVKKPQVFWGKRSQFVYDHVSEQGGIRKPCCIPIPPWKDKHDGKHCHTLNPAAVHLCPTRCPVCAYICHLPLGHPGLHETTHGNMRDVRFVADSEEIDLGDRKYAWGESCVAEMCMMHCRNRGRGHIHLVTCPGIAHGRKELSRSDSDEREMEYRTDLSKACKEGICEGARHQTREYGPDTTVPKDEMTHAAYWKYFKFKDPCQEEDQKQFEMCGHYCPSEEHTPQNRSYCIERLWHQPVSTTQSSATAAHVTKDGHVFRCTHVKDTPSHVVFAIDKSGSMFERDMRPTLNWQTRSLDNRLGCVYEAVIRFIRTRVAAGQSDFLSVVVFSGKADIVLEGQPISDVRALAAGLCQYTLPWGTNYSLCLEKVEKILQRASQRADMKDKPPVVIFLSDGKNEKGTDPIPMVKKMKDSNPSLIFHTILFGKQKYVATLQKMADAGTGKHYISVDEIQLAKRFSSLADSLRPQVACPL